MENVEHQANIAEEGEVKIHHKNIRSDVIALEICNLVMNSVINNSPNENHTNIFSLKVYKNGIVALSELLTRELDTKTTIQDKELIQGYEAIINLLEQFIRPKSDAEHYYQQGQRLYRNGDYEAALISFEEASNIINRSCYYHYKGKTYLKLKRAKEAIKALDEVMKLNPSDSECYKDKGYALASLEKHHEAIRYYNRAIELNPDYAEAYYYKGRSLCELFRYAEAVICFSKASTINPNCKSAIIHKENTIQYLKNRTLQEQTKDFLKRVGKTKLIGR